MGNQKQPISSPRRALWGQQVGILVANASAVNPQLLAACGITAEMPIVISSQIRIQRPPHRSEKSS